MVFNGTKMNVAFSVVWEKGELELAVFAALTGNTPSFLPILLVGQVASSDREGGK